MRMISRWEACWLKFIFRIRIPLFLHRPRRFIVHVLRIIFLAALPSCRQLNRDRVSSKSIFDRTFLYPHFFSFYRSFFKFLSTLFFFSIAFLRARARSILFHSAFFFSPPKCNIIDLNVYLRKIQRLNV